MPTMKAGVSTWVSSARPTVPRYGETYHGVKGSDAFALYRFASPVPQGEGAVVSSAVLSIYQRGAWAEGTSARWCTGSWRPARVVWGTQPTVAASPVAGTRVGAGDGARIDYIVTADVQAIADGGPNHGWRIETTAATRRLLYGFRSGEAGYLPTLTVTYSLRPEAPTDVTPSRVVGVAAPVFAWVTDEPVTSVRLQTSATADFATVTWDCEVGSTLPQIDTAAHGWAGLADGASTWVRVQQTNDGGASDWSPPFQITRRNKGALTVYGPPATVTDKTPPVQWALTGATQAAWRYSLLKPDGSVLADDHAATTETTVALPVKLKLGVTYTARLRVWDTYDRDASPGDRPYLEWTGPVTYTPGSSGGPVITAVTQAPDFSPLCTLAVSFAQIPDEWSLYRDEVLIGEWEAGDLTPVSAGQWAIPTWRLNPNVINRLRLVAKTGSTSLESAAYLHTPTVKALWLVADTVTPVRWVTMNGGPPEGARPHDYATLTPARSRYTNIIHVGRRGYTGEMSGELSVRGAPSRTLTDQETDMQWMVDRPLQVVRLITGDVNIPVVLTGLDRFTSPRSQGPGLMHTAGTFSYYEQPELDG